MKINSDWKDLDNASVQISDWKMISISEYEPHRKIWKRYTENHFDILREICEMDLNNDLVLKGFGKKKWLLGGIQNDFSEDYSANR